MNSKGNFIVSQSSKKLLSAAVSVNHGILKSLKIALHANIVQFSVYIPVFYLQIIFEFLKRQADTVKFMLTKKLEVKLHSLTNVKISTYIKSSYVYKRVINLSSAPFSQSNLVFLSKGLNCSLGPSKLNVPVFLASFEPVFKKFNSNARHEIRFIIPSYVFTKADKGRCVVIRNR